MSSRRRPARPSSLLLRRPLDRTPTSRMATRCYATTSTSTLTRVPARRLLTSLPSRWPETRSPPTLSSSGFFPRLHRSVADRHAGQPSHHQQRLASTKTKAPLKKATIALPDLDPDVKLSAEQLAVLELVKDGKVSPHDHPSDADFPADEDKSSFDTVRASSLPVLQVCFVTFLAEGHSSAGSLGTKLTTFSPLVLTRTGTGKSLLLKHIIHSLLSPSSSGVRREVAVTSSTGTASVQLNGRTLHSWAGIGRGAEDAETIYNTWKGYKKSSESLSSTVHPVGMVGRCIPRRLRFALRPHSAMTDRRSPSFVPQSD